ncbi:proton-associated sugar transporter A-like [Bolinopsis microptera]|uniref:proton-associated sugar transporter A-like n=1 Tax=Bolinopsis microptera TaxID=2820187 RepID=UPI003078CB09
MTSSVDQKVSILSLLRASAIFGAIEFVYSAETAYSTPLLESAGIDEKYTALTWSMSPVIGFVLQPIVGILSDRCMCRWGRRKPFILILALIIFTASFILPLSRDIGTNLGNIFKFSPTVITGAVTVISVIMLDFCNDSIHTPLRAFLADAYPRTVEVQELSNTLYSIVGGFGGMFGYILCSIDTSFVEEPISRLTGSKEYNQEKAVFGVCIVVLILGTVITLTSRKERNPNLEGSEEEPLIQKRREILKISDDNEPEMIIKAHSLQEGDESRISLRTLVLSIVKIPGKIAVLMIMQLLTSSIMFCYFLYFTTFVAKVVYNASPGDKHFTDGVRWGCLGMTLMSLTCITFSFLLPTFIKRTSIKAIYFISHVAACAGFALMPWFANKTTVILFSIFPGVLNSVYLVLPFILLSQIHQIPAIKAERGYATDVALLVSSTFASQVLLNMFLGTVIEITGINVVMYTASVIACVGAFVSLYLPVMPKPSIYKTVSAISIVGSLKSGRGNLLMSSTTFNEDWDDIEDMRSEPVRSEPARSPTKVRFSTRSLL